jgi:hypothetical protein
MNLLIIDFQLEDAKLTGYTRESKNQAAANRIRVATRARDQTRPFVVQRHTHLSSAPTIINMATSPKSRSRKSAGKNGKDVVEEVPEEAPGSEEEDEEEGYEVEAILGAKWAYNKRVSTSLSAAR